MRTVTTQFQRDRRGATMVEYGLMLALVAVVCMAVIAVIGRNMDRAFGDANNGFVGVVPGAEATP